MVAGIAETRDQARRAAHKAKVEYRELPFAGDVAAARAAGGELVTESMTLKRGDVSAALASAPKRISGRMRLGGQDHFYLEGQVALAIPGEDDEVTLYSSTQHPSEIQHMVGHALACRPRGQCHHPPDGRGLWRRETQGNLLPWRAIAAKKYGRAVKIRPDRDDDMTATGKRHDFVVDYEVV